MRSYARVCVGVPLIGCAIKTEVWVGALASVFHFRTDSPDAYVLGVPLLLLLVFLQNGCQGDRRDNASLRSAMT
ncbi:hypothetical protein PCAR4_1040004 [Paraburkholderia caribensis]|nr:hypothetical protein PCAR4_1040004 [Paraburkholderia caribensis]